MTDEHKSDLVPLSYSSSRRTPGTLRGRIVIRSGCEKDIQDIPGAQSWDDWFDGAIDPANSMVERNQP